MGKRSRRDDPLCKFIANIGRSEAVADTRELGLIFKTLSDGGDPFGYRLVGEGSVPSLPCFVVKVWVGRLVVTVLSVLPNGILEIWLASDTPFWPFYLTPRK